MTTATTPKKSRFYETIHKKFLHIHIGDAILNLSIDEF